MREKYKNKLFSILLLLCVCLMKLMLENRTQLVGISYLFIVAAVFASFEGVKPSTRVLMLRTRGFRGSSSLAQRVFMRFI